MLSEAAAAAVAAANPTFRMPLAAHCALGDDASHFWAHVAPTPLDARADADALAPAPSADAPAAYDGTAPATATSAHVRRSVAALLRQLSAGEGARPVHVVIGAGRGDEDVWQQLARDLLQRGGEGEESDSDGDEMAQCTREIVAAAIEAGDVLDIHGDVVRLAGDSDEDDSDADSDSDTEKGGSNWSDEDGDDEGGQRPR